MAKSAKILIVEDDQFLLDLYTELLGGEGYEVEQAINGGEALTKMTKGGYDLVLLDIMLPEKDGITVLKEMTKEQRQKTGQVVLLTNLNQEAIINEGFALGAVGYLIKSALAPDQVLTEVRSFINAKK